MRGLIIALALLVASPALASETPCKDFFVKDVPAFFTTGVPTFFTEALPAWGEHVADRAVATGEDVKADVTAKFNAVKDFFTSAVEPLLW